MLDDSQASVGAPAVAADSHGDSSNVANVSECHAGQNSGDAKCLSDKQYAAVELLAAGHSILDTANAVEVDRRTVFRWRKDKRFMGAVRRRRHEVWSCAGDRIRALLEQSLIVVEKRLSDHYEPSRFKAATTLLRLSGIHRVARPK